MVFVTTSETQQLHVHAIARQGSASTTCLHLRNRRQEELEARVIEEETARLVTAAVEAKVKEVMSSQAVQQSLQERLVRERKLLEEQVCHLSLLVLLLNLFSYIQLNGNWQSIKPMVTCCLLMCVLCGPLTPLATPCDKLHGCLLEPMLGQNCGVGYLVTPACCTPTLLWLYRCAMQYLFGQQTGS